MPEINDPQQDLNNYTVDMKEMKKVMKKYKKMKRYMKSSMYEINKLSGKKTFIDKLVDEYGENPNSVTENTYCLLYTSPSPRDLSTSRMPSSA